MSRRLSISACAAALAVGVVLTGAVAAPAGAASTAAAPAAVATSAGRAATATAKPARLSVTTPKITTVTTPFALTTTSRLPVLTGSTAKNRARVTTHAKALIAAEQQMVATWRAGCADSAVPASVAVASVNKAVYQGRYASVTMAFQSDAGCGGVTQQSARSFTLDLKTGKKVKLSRFAAGSAGVTRLAMLSALRAQNPGCVLEDMTVFRGATTSLPTPDAWNVSAKGVRVWFNRYAVAPGACGAVSARVPWAAVATSAQLAGPRSTRVYVKDLTLEAGSYSGDIAVLTVQGRQVARIDGHLFSEATCTLGVRTGTQVRGFERATGTRVDYPLGGTVKAPALKLGAGWRRATSTELAGLKQAGVGADAIKGCAV